MDERNTRIVGQAGSIIRWLSHNAWADGQRMADLAVIEAPILHGPQTGSFFDRAQLWAASTASCGRAAGASPWRW